MQLYFRRQVVGIHSMFTQNLKTQLRVPY